MNRQRLYIIPEPHMRELYLQAADAYNTTPDAERNSGFDLYSDFVSTVKVLRSSTFLVSQGCRAIAVDEAEPRAFWLAPRSSISKTPFRLANSLGLIDATYRGTIYAAVDCLDADTDLVAYNRQRLVQLTPADLRPWLEIIVVDEMPVANTARGAGGFGSTGVL
jgi:dUTP pyrophosphatase